MPPPRLTMTEPRICNTHNHRGTQVAHLVGELTRPIQAFSYCSCGAIDIAFHTSGLGLERLCLVQLLQVRLVLARHCDEQVIFLLLVAGVGSCPFLDPSQCDIGSGLWLRCRGEIGCFGMVAPWCGRVLRRLRSLASEEAHLLEATLYTRLGAQSSTPRSAAMVANRPSEVLHAPTAPRINHLPP